jgi:hypothetical protein
MLSEEQIRKTLRRRAWVLLPSAGGASVAVCVYFFVVGRFLDPEDRGGLLAIVLILPVFPIFLAPLLITERFATRFRIACPNCGGDLRGRTQLLLATRCCPLCDSHVIEGRPRSKAAYRRSCGIRNRAFLKYWLWAWPAMGFAGLAWTWFDHSAFEDCLHFLWVVPLIGFVAAGWSWLRTHDRRYWPQTAASLAICLVGAAVYWRGF